ncbi:hypothetical protein ABEB36_007502 [Hypothenemus hampei]|uniref:Uncharacterized protein n=1 Tax=Hypothenemus hampei TaxID=57062 RepID=A0ABD1EU76_HYPHA
MKIADNLVLIPLDKIIVDISFHFERKSPRAGVREKSKYHKLLQIAKGYYTSEKLEEIAKPLWVEYQFKIKLNNKEFLAHFLKNSYHQIEIENFSGLENDAKGNIFFKFTTGNSKHSFTFNKDSRVITLKSNIFDMVKLKHYLCNENTIKIENSENSFNTAGKMRTEMCSTDKSDACAVYRSFRALWSQL